MDWVWSFCIESLLHRIAVLADKHSIGRCGLRVVFRAARTALLVDSGALLGSNGSAVAANTLGLVACRSTGLNESLRHSLVIHDGLFAHIVVEILQRFV